MLGPLTCMDPIQQYAKQHVMLCFYNLQNQFLNCNWLRLLNPFYLASVILSSLWATPKWPCTFWEELTLGYFGLYWRGNICVVGSNFPVLLSLQASSYRKNSQEYLQHNCAKMPGILKGKARGHFMIGKCPIAHGTKTIRRMESK